MPTVETDPNKMSTLDIINFRHYLWTRFHDLKTIMSAQTEQVVLQKISQCTEVINRRKTGGTR